VYATTDQKKATSHQQGSPRRRTSKDRGLPSHSSIELKIFDALREAGGDIMVEMAEFFKTDIHQIESGQFYLPDMEGYIDHTHFYTTMASPT